MKFLIMLSSALILVACGDGTHSLPPTGNGDSESGQGEGIDDEIPVNEPKPDPEEPGGDNCVPSGMPIVVYADADKEVFTAVCTRCHSGQNPPAGIVLDNFEDAKKNLAKARQAVESGRMPPNGNLSDDQKNILAAWQNLGAPEFVEDVNICPDN